MIYKNKSSCRNHVKEQQRKTDVRKKEKDVESKENREGAERK